MQKYYILLFSLLGILVVGLFVFLLPTYYSCKDSSEPLTVLEVQDFELVPIQSSTLQVIRSMLFSSFTALDSNFYIVLLSYPVHSVLGIILLIPLVLSVYKATLGNDFGLSADSFTYYIRPIVVIFLTAIPKLSYLWSLSEFAHRYPASLGFFRNVLYLASLLICRLLNVFQFDLIPIHSLPVLLYSLSDALDTYTLFNCMKYFSLCDITIVSGAFRTVFLIFFFSPAFPSLFRIILIFSFIFLALSGSSLFHLEYTLDAKNQALLQRLVSTLLLLYAHTFRSSYAINYSKRLLALLLFAIIGIYSEPLLELKNYPWFSINAGMKFFLINLAAIPSQLICPSQIKRIKGEFGYYVTLFFKSISELLHIVMVVFLLTCEKATILNFIGAIFYTIADIIYTNGLLFLV